MRSFCLVLIGTLLVTAINNLYPAKARAEDSVYSEISTEKLIKNHDEIVKALKLGTYYTGSSDNKRPRRVRIGIFDNGFAGFQDSKKKRIDKNLPKDTEYIDFSENQSNFTEESDNHGYALATVISEMMTDGRQIPELAPKIYLFRTVGFTALKKATDYSVEQNLNLDIVLYAQVFEYGGNFDGKGFYNQVVTDFLARSKNTIWINAAGNFGKNVFNSPVIKSENRNNFVQLPDPADSLIIKCDPYRFTPTTDSCRVRIVLSWNDFKNSADSGSKKNLDMLLLDDLNSTVNSSALIQVPQKTTDSKFGETLNPREIIDGSLKAGTYYIRVRDSSNNFDPGKDKFRISVYGPGIFMPSHDRQESLLTPADNPRVITVGANDDDGMSSISLNLKKPNLSVYSTIDLPDSLVTNFSIDIPDSFSSTTSRDTIKRGSSAASGLIAAKAGLILSRSRMKNLSLKDMLAFLKKDNSSTTPQPEQDPQQPTVPLSIMKFTPQPKGGKGCFEAVNLADFKKNYPGLGVFVSEQDPQSAKPFYAYAGAQKIIVLFFMEDPIDACSFDGKSCQSLRWREARLDPETGEDRPLHIPAYDPTLDPKSNSKIASNVSPFKLLTRNTILKKNVGRDSNSSIIQFEQFPKGAKDCRNPN